MVYPTGVIANKDVSFDIQRNTVHAVVGENGAGKSTLMNIIFGKVHPQEGLVVYNGNATSFKTPDDAINSGIGMVHQHLMLVPDMTVAENLVLGIEPKKHKFFLDTSEAIKITREVSERYGLFVPVEEKIKDLPIGVRQRVEILKALIRNAEVLILDEPTAVLTPQETEVFFDTLIGLKENGKTIIFISHKLDEVQKLADRVTVMRNTRAISTLENDQISIEKISDLMVGRVVDSARISPPLEIGEPILSVDEISYTNENDIQILKNVSLDIRSGEILGVAGVEGNGQSELINIITGLVKPSSGVVTVDGIATDNLSPRQIREMNVSHIPEDRMENGIASDASIEENIIVDRYYKPPFSEKGHLNWKLIKDHASDLVSQFNVLTPSTKVSIGSLSGGNIQKVVVARELSSAPRLIVAAQPTRGVDIGSEELIHGRLKKARDDSKAIFLISADLDEILKLSTRIIVMYDGGITKHFDQVSKVSKIDIGPYMLGVDQVEGASGKVPS